MACGQKNLNNMKKFIALMCVVALALAGVNDAAAKTKKIRKNAPKAKVEVLKTTKSQKVKTEIPGEKAKECSDKVKAASHCDKAKAEGKCEKAEGKCQKAEGKCEKAEVKKGGLKKLNKAENMSLKKGDIKKADCKEMKGECKDMKGDCKDCEKKNECSHQNPCCKEGACKKDASCGKEKCKANPEACCK